MMKIISRATLFLLLVTTSASCTDRRSQNTTHQPNPAPADAPSALSAAHEAYLAGDYVEMNERLKDVIVDPRAGELAQDNAFALLESAYEATRGHLPSRTTNALPASMKVITLGVLNGTHPFGTHRLIFLNMHLTEGLAAHLKDIRLTKLPNEPILSLADKRGALRVAHNAEKRIDDVSIDVRNLDVLPDRGAFAIQVTFDDGTPGLDTYVLANKLLASTQPELTSPTVSQVLKDPHPEIAWHPYRSQQFAPWESRSLSLAISGDSVKRDVWTFYKWEPAEDLGSLHVGDPKGGTPSTAALEPDSYWLSLMCMEDRVFGNVRISRASQTARPFSVVR
jgi:hypothetical protein